MVLIAAWCFVVWCFAFKFTCWMADKSIFVAEAEVCFWRLLARLSCCSLCSETYCTIVLLGRRSISFQWVFCDSVTFTNYSSVEYVRNDGCPSSLPYQDIYFSVSDLFNNLDNAQMREQHLLLLLSGVLPWIDPPDVISKEIEEGRSGRSAVQHSNPACFLCLVFQL